MLYAYEKLDLKRLRQTKIGSYRLEMSKLAIGLNATNQWLKMVLLTGGFLGLLGIGYYLFPNILAILNQSNHEVTQISLPTNHSKSNRLSTSAIPTSPLTKVIPVTNSVNIIENQSINPVVGLKLILMMA